MENLTVKLFNEIAEKQLPGLALFENRTGSGKTTGALQWVTDMLMKSKESDVIIYITPNRQNRDEAWRGLDWLDKHIEEFFATNQLNLIDNRIARDERIEDIKAALVQLLPTVKINIRPTVEDNFGYNLVVINNKQYFQMD